MGSLCSKSPSERIYVHSKAKYRDLIRTYKLDHQSLGKGSFGSVYKAENRDNSRHKLAIKVINKTKLSKSEIMDLYEEVKTLNSLDHPNIVKYYETYDDAKNIYLCMELCTGGELK